MKKVLVTGAAGSIGLLVLKYLLSEGKYEITALDLKNKGNIKKLKKYNKRINIVYGDIIDNILMEGLVKSHDVIIHLASVLPPFSELSKTISEMIEYNGTENIIKAINYYNKNCYLIYASTTSLYDSSLTGNIKEKINETNLTNFSLVKFRVEKLIKEKIKQYTILRVPLVLNNITNEPFIYNIKNNTLIEVTTKEDAAYAFVKSIEYQTKLNKKVFNIGMGKDGIIKYGELLNNILKNYGLSFRYILSRIFLEKNYHSPILSDSDDLDSIIHYRIDTLNNYYKRLKRYNKRHKMRLLLAKIVLLFRKK